MNYVMWFVLTSDTPLSKNKSQKLSRKLFMLLSISDLCTNSYPVLHILYFCLSPTVNIRVNTNYDQDIDYMFR